MKSQFCIDKRTGSMNNGRILMNMACFSLLGIYLMCPSLHKLPLGLASVSALMPMPLKILQRDSNAFVRRFANNGGAILASDKGIGGDGMDSTPKSRQKNEKSEGLQNKILPSRNSKNKSRTTTRDGAKTGKPRKPNNAQRKRGPAPSNNLNRAKAINKEVINLSSAQEILDFFVARGGAKGVGGGGVFNSVNYSTIMHRLARFATYVDYTKVKGGAAQSAAQEENRRLILSDPRFAIVISSLAEAIVQSKSVEGITFNHRELANVGWAIAKLKMAPPISILPISSPTAKVDNNVNIKYAAIEDMHSEILSTAVKLRSEVLQVAKDRKATLDPSQRAQIKNTWIPTLSQLSGKLLDVIACQVLQILSDFNSQELANLLYAFATAERADNQVFEKLANQLILSMERQTGTNNAKVDIKHSNLPKPQEFSISVWAFATAGLRGPGQIKLTKCLANALDSDSGKFVKEFKPQELSNTAWGLATSLSIREHDDSKVELEKEYDAENESAVRVFRWVAKSLQERADDFKSQELSNSIWAFATVGFGATIQNTGNNDLILGFNQPEDDRELIARTLDAVVKSSIPRLHKFRPQELNNLSWGICRLGHYNSDYRELLEGIAREIMKRKHQFAPQDIGTTLWSFASMEYFEEDVYRSACSRLSLRHCRSFKPQELSNTVWALATAGVFPKDLSVFDTTLVSSSKRMTISEITKDSVTECFAAATTELIRRPLEFKEQEIKDLLWSLSKAGVRHPAVFKSVAKHLVGSDSGHTGRGLDNFSSQGLGNLAWSYAKQAQLATEVSDGMIESTGRLAVYETSWRDVGEPLIKRLFSKIAERAIDSNCGLSTYKPQDISNTCWAFASLGILHRSFFGAVSTEVQERLQPKSKDSVELPKFKAQEIANLVWSFATLNSSADGLMEHLTPYILSMCRDEKGNYDEHSIAKFFKRQEALSVAWSCVVLEQYPPQLMPLLYTALFGTNNDTDSLKSIHGDNGLPKQGVMALFYVQMAMDMEVPQLGMTLPLNFPDGWVVGDHAPKALSSEDKEGGRSMLELTTSRLQQDVSRTLERVGFSHVLEHVITTDELESSHNIRLSPEKVEFLSIDIANLNDLVGIEVDGPGHFVNVLDCATDNDGEKERYFPSGKKLSGKGAKMEWQLSNSRRLVNGPTALKHRLLCQLGWQIVHLPFWEWRNLSDQENEESYCRELLEGTTIEGQ